MVTTFLCHILAVFISAFSCVFFNMNGYVSYRDTGNTGIHNILSISMLVLGVFGSFQSMVFLVVLEFTISLTRNKISIESSYSSSSDISINTNDLNNDSFNAVTIPEAEPANILVSTPFNDSDSPPKYNGPEKCLEKTLPEYEAPPSYNLSIYK
jgi:hypothetical protein